MKRTSSLLDGRIVHERYGPQARRFSYRTRPFMLDLDELEEMERSFGWLFGVDRRRPLALRTSTHLGNDPGATMRERLDACLARHERPAATGTVLLVANLAVFGYVFNPVSWWCCYDDQGVPHTIIAEVRNTFGESHTYAIPADDSLDPADRWMRSRTDKRLHVSPFLPLDLRYDLAVRVPSPTPIEGEHASFVVRVLGRDGSPRFVGAQVGRRLLITRTRLLTTLLRFPVAPQLVTVRIHWQAVKLWVRRAPFFRKPPFRPHTGSLEEGPT